MAGSKEEGHDGGDDVIKAFKWTFRISAGLYYSIGLTNLGIFWFCSLSVA
jgi:hypothetical protein